MKLERQDALHRPALLVIIQDLGRGPAVDGLGQVVPACRDDVLVPVTLLYDRADLVRVSQVPRLHRLAVRTDAHFFPDLREDAAAALLVDDPGIRVARLEVGLIAADDP